MSALAEVLAAQTPPAVTGTPGTGVAALQQRLNQMDRGQRLRWGVYALAVVAVVAAVLFSRQPDYKVLFSSLTDKDAGAIVAQLTQMNVPYRYTEGGGAILVPADKVHDARLKLATQFAQGLSGGFEADGQQQIWVVTQFQERVNYQRALEGELTRSIQGLAGGARCPRAPGLPNQNGFFREQQAFGLGDRQSLPWPWA